MIAVKDFFYRIRYSSYLIFHPFKGFWDLKRGGIGRIGPATAFILLLALVEIISSQFTGFIVNYNDILKTNIFFVAIRTAGIVLVWVIANWSVTTLMEGEGKLKDIYIATAYALVPYIVSTIISVILSNFITAEESSFYYLIQAIGLIWSAFLLLVGFMTLHQFSFGKTIATVIITAAAMIVILFLFLMFLTLLQQMINFVLLIYQEATQ